MSKQARLGVLIALLCATCVAALLLRRAAEPEALEPDAPFERIEGERVALEPWFGIAGAPIEAVALPGASERYLVIEKTGGLFLVERDRAEPIGSISAWVGPASGERGLLGVAFPPGDAPTHVFLSFTAVDGTSTLARAPFDPERAHVETSALEILFEVEQPYGNHNGGQVFLGPDGMLYWALGDGGAGGDPLDHGENCATLLGSLLRFDARGHALDIPDDNPFVGHERCRPEVFAYGLRNPWRSAFDGDTLWIADVGQNAWEEINALSLDAARGAYFGWNTFEAHACFVPEDCQRAAAGPAATGMRSAAVDAEPVWPVHAYDHDEGCSITGGYVYRGAALEGLAGAYLFTDFCNAAIRALVPDEEGYRVETLVHTELQVPSITPDAAGEPVVLDMRGRAYRMVPR